MTFNIFHNLFLSSLNWFKIMKKGTGYSFKTIQFILKIIQKSQFKYPV